MQCRFTISRVLQYQNIHAFGRFPAAGVAKVAHSVGDGGGDLVGGEGEAGADGGELRVVFAEVLGIALLNPEGDGKSR